ncbi:hypothetical protein BGZ49_005232, partial [Haplosporangium sp. Z 27]
MTAHDYFEIYKHDLEMISTHSGVSKEIQKRANYLLQSIQCDKLTDTLSAFANRGGTKESRAE